MSNATQLALHHFAVSDNQLFVGGRSISEWAAELGTPFYLYDLAILRKKIELFRNAIPSGIKLYYAVKANPFGPLLEYMVPLVDGFDVASSGEMEGVLEAGTTPDTISFAGPGKTQAELQRALELRIGSINVESSQELEHISALANAMGLKPRVSIRINPDFELHGSGMKMGGGPKQFGIDAEVVPTVLERIRQLPLDFQGFHIYAGSQNLQAGVIAEAMERSLDLIWRLAGPAAESIQLLNLGGGFGIPYFEKDAELDIHFLGQALDNLLGTYRPRFPQANFIIELGRYLTGECGMYVTRVLYRKISRGKTYLITDGGMNHHLAASGNLGQVLRKNFPIVVANRLCGDEMETVDITGPLCTPLDILGARIKLPSPKEGDLIAVLNSGAYGYTASPLLFLGHTLPAQLCVTPCAYNGNI